MCAIKRCRLCDQEKPVSEFGNTDKNSDGLRSWCRECANRKSREYRVKNRERVLRPAPEERRCSRCKQTLSASRFHKDPGRGDGLQPCCKDCNRDWAKTRQKRNTEKHQTLEVFSKPCSRCREIKVSSDFTVERSSPDGVSWVCRECQAQEHREFRYDVLSHYSGGGEPKCECCGEKHLEFLSIDHPNGGGIEHRKQAGGAGATFYRWLKKHGYPEGLRILCHNCNQSYGWYSYCPHQRERDEKDE